jgi:hypothetical protein
MKKLILITAITLAGCTKVDLPEPQPINLGTVSTSTSINKLTQVGNTVTAEFNVTIGSKYSVQIVPFGEEKPAKIEGFTADESLVTKTYDLSSLKKMDYDIILIDVAGTETKRPIIVK